VRDIWGDNDQPRCRVLLIRRDALSRVWPEPVQPWRTPAPATALPVGQNAAVADRADSTAPVVSPPADTAGAAAPQQGGPGNHRSHSTVDAAHERFDEGGGSRYLAVPAANSEGIPDAEGPIIAAARQHLATTYPNGVPAGVTNKMLAAEYRQSKGAPISDRTMRRARKPRPTAAKR
jgi:hypothetical protein